MKRYEYYFPIIKDFVTKVHLSNTKYSGYVNGDRDRDKSISMSKWFALFIELKRDSLFSTKKGNRIHKFLEYKK